jgi:hypothetical protein
MVNPESVGLAAGIESGDCRSALGLRLTAYRSCESAIYNLQSEMPMSLSENPLTELRRYNLLRYRAKQVSMGSGCVRRIAGTPTHSYGR